MTGDLPRRSKFVCQSCGDRMVKGVLADVPFWYHAGPAMPRILSGGCKDPFILNVNAWDRRLPLEARR